MSKKRTTLVLKKEYKNKIVTKKMLPFGDVTFDTNKVTKEEYPNYVRIGFGECFEEVEQVDATTAQIEEMKSKMKAFESGKVVVEDYQEMEAPEPDGNEFEMLEHLEDGDNLAELLGGVEQVEEVEQVEKPKAKAKQPQKTPVKNAPKK